MESKSKKISGEERIALADKLDKELDDFISGLEKKAYTDGWKEDQWQEEMERHPFFMKRAPDEGEEDVSPLVQGLQQLKYSSEENTPLELAESYKEDGNFNFKCKNYRMAVIGYSEGLRQDFSNSELKSQLYSNRAAAHFQLKNFRSCYNDCKLALQEKPDYPKAKRRLAQACLQLSLYDECTEVCDSVLAGSDDSDLRRLRAEAEKEKRVKERDRRKQEVSDRKAALNKDKLRQLVQQRGVRFYPKPFWEMEEQEAIPHQVYIEDDKLVWPVIFLYPEYKVTDIIQHFREDTTFEEEICEVFKKPPDWDADLKYTPKSVVVYYEDINGRIHSVDKSTTLRDVVSQQDYRVDGCTPAFLILAKGSSAHENFLKQY